MNRSEIGALDPARPGANVGVEGDSISTAAQITANRSNAQLSTGPVSAPGKQAVAKNALKHGLYSKSPVIPGESAAEYSALRDELMAEYRPRTAEDVLLCEQLIDAVWRSRRIERLETNWFTNNPDPDFNDPKVFRVWAEVGRQHARYQRIIQTYLKRLTPATGSASEPEAAELALNSRIEEWDKLRPVRLRENQPSASSDASLGSSSRSMRSSDASIIRRRWTQKVESTGGLLPQTRFRARLKTGTTVVNEHKVWNRP